MEHQHKKQHPALKSFFTDDKQRYTFYFDLAPNSAPHKIDVYLQARTITEDALLIAIEEINKVLRKENIQLVVDVRLYKARLVGRNFKPKTDLPCLSLYQKICDLKIEQIAVQIPNKEKAIRTITTHIQISQEKSEIVTLHEQKEPNRLKNQEEVVKLVQENHFKKQQAKDVGNGLKIQKQQKQQQGKKDLGQQKAQKDESSSHKKQQNQTPVQAKEILEQVKVVEQQTKVTVALQPIITDKPLVNQGQNLLEQTKAKEQIPLNLNEQKKELTQQASIQQIKEEVQTTAIVEQPQKLHEVQDSKQFAKLLKQLIEERKELVQLRKEIAQQRKDLREQRKDLREQRNEVRLMRKELSEQRARLQHSRKELSDFYLKIKLQRNAHEQALKLSVDI